VTSLNVEIGPKQVELLHELVPAARSIALLVNPGSPTQTEATTREVQAADMPDAPPPGYGGAPPPGYGDAPPPGNVAPRRKPPAKQQQVQSKEDGKQQVQPKQDSKQQVEPKDQE
jgi:hypothetical protein